MSNDKISTEEKGIAFNRLVSGRFATIKALIALIYLSMTMGYLRWKADKINMSKFAWWEIKMINWLTKGWLQTLR